MFDIAWSELAVIGAVALIVIGPKDLPKVMRTMGQWSRKMRFLANEFQRNFDDMVRHAELDELRRETMKSAEALKAEAESLLNKDEFEAHMRSLDEAHIAPPAPEPKPALADAIDESKLEALPPGVEPPVPPPEDAPPEEATPETSPAPPAAAPPAAAAPGKASDPGP